MSGEPVIGTQLEYWRDLQAKVFFQDLHLLLGFYDPLRETIFLSLV